MDSNFNWETLFPDHVFRYLRGGIKTKTYNKDYNTTQKLDVYFTVNGFSKFEKQDDPQDKEHITSLNAFFIDCDFKDPNTKEFLPDKMEEFRNVILPEIVRKTPPTVVVETGCGFHIYWCFDEPLYKYNSHSNEYVVEKELDFAQELHEYEEIQSFIVKDYFKDYADPKAANSAFIMRYPGSIYHKDNINNGKIIKVLPEFSNIANTYTKEEVKDMFQYREIKKVVPSSYKDDYVVKINDLFWKNVEDKSPIIERSSFQKMLSGVPESLPPAPNNSRNHALLVLASLACHGGMSQNDLIHKVLNTDSGWHGMLSERGGKDEIITTINSAYKNQYKMFNDIVVKHNTDTEEEVHLLQVRAEVNKKNREGIKMRFDIFEDEFMKMYPHIIHIEGDRHTMYIYKNGVYVHFTERELKELVVQEVKKIKEFSGFNTPSHISAKVMIIMAHLATKKESDNNNKIINVRNGLLDITTMELKPHTPDFISVTQIQTDYVPGFHAPNWDKAISDWMNGDEKDEKTKILQKFSGYCLTQSTQADKALFLLGSGSNGKSVFARVINQIIGRDSTSNLSLDDLNRDFGPINLLGKQVNITEEIEDGKITATRVIKDAISGNLITANVKFGSYVTFNAKAKFIICTNTMPKIVDPSNGFHRRVLPVRFNNSFIDNPDTFLTARLYSELPGILNWMIEGLNEFIKDDMKFKPENETLESKSIMKEFREDNNPIERFLTDCYSVSNAVLITTQGETRHPINTQTIKEMYAIYEKWDVQENGLYNKFKVKKKGFKTQLKSIAMRDKNFEYIVSDRKQTDSIIGLVYIGDDNLLGNTFD